MWCSNLQSMDYKPIWNLTCDISLFFFFLFMCWIAEINNSARQGEVTGKMRSTHLSRFNDLLRRSTMVFPHDVNIDFPDQGNLSKVIMIICINLDMPHVTWQSN